MALIVANYYSLPATTVNWDETLEVTTAFLDALFNTTVPQLGMGSFRDFDLDKLNMTWDSVMSSLMAADNIDMDR